MSLESRGPQRRMLLDDPMAIRAFAHPIRLELHAMLGRTGPLTAAEAARRLGISQALASHHLRQLAKYGFVEPAPGQNNRDRPWRVTSTSQDWADAELTAEGAAAVGVLERVVVERALGALIAWNERRGSEPREWREHTGVSHSTVYLTAAELARLEEQLSELIQGFISERPIDDVDSRPVGSRPVDLTYLLSVLPDEESS